MKVSQRFHNDTYAPGIATYGIDGKTGEQGESGNSVFFSEYTITDKSDFKQLVQKITSRKIPSKLQDIVLDRNYINGDSFICNDGKVYMLKDVNQMIKDVDNGDYLKTDDSNYFTQIGIIDPSLCEPFKTLQDKSVRIDKLNIVEDNNSINKDSDGLLNIIRNGNNVIGDLDFISMQALCGSNPDVNLDIKYDTTNKAYVLSSKYPIIIDANLYVNQDNETKQLSKYSPVLTTKNDAITTFIGTCKEISYELNSSIYSYTKDDSSTLYYGAIHYITLSDNVEDLDESDNLERYYSDYINDGENENKVSLISVHFQNKEYQDFQFYRKSEKTYCFKQDYGYVKLNDLINKIKYTDLNDIQISLIYNLEVYLRKSNSALVGSKS